MSDWKLPLDQLRQPIELEEDYDGHLYAPIEDVTERLNQVFDGLWDVEILERDFLEQTDETLVKVRVTFHTLEGVPNIVKEALGGNKVVRLNKNNEIKSLTDSFESAVSQGIKRAAKRIEVALRKQFQNPALNNNEPTRNTSNNQSSSQNQNDRSKSNGDDLDRNKILKKVEQVRKDRGLNEREAKTMMVNSFNKAGTKDCSTKQLKEFLEILQKKRCEECREEISKKVVGFCKNNENRFDGKILCMNCQKEY
ncbi:hypothetical protein [Sporohalobacter salinus]|uniref:hypothetical protein n=1 Tax=Sporohalobacter salinus TaxID=1494606 RepID=UPI00195F2ADB|nr:hypothetical protein [Sporohalobacter salinus]MBM7624760.1 hypothetical protein [Sporohalobacter salinus]